MTELNYKKIIVIGCSGAGKTTFSKKLAQITDIPLYHLDSFYWKEDATHISRCDLIKKQKAVFKTDKWIIDGNFRNTLEMRVKESELIYFFDIPKDVCVQGVINRNSRDELPCELPVNDELIGFIENFERDVKPFILNLFDKYSDKRIITFHSRNEADEYLEKLRKNIKMQNITNDFLGKNVTIIIDRPLGSQHPNHKELVYHVNYGYVQGVFAPDGEEQDAYVYGVDEPLEQFTGKVIAIIHRLNDVEDKLVVADANISYSKEEIKQQVIFQEQYFDFEIITND